MELGLRRPAPPFNLFLDFKQESAFAAAKRRRDAAT